MIESCTIVTAAAPDAISDIHNRIPVHLSGEQIPLWVDNGTDKTDLAAMLAPEIRTSIRITPVSTYVNNARNKDERCIEPIGDGKVIH